MTDASPRPGAVRLDPKVLVLWRLRAAAIVAGSGLSAGVAAGVTLGPLVGGGAAVLVAALAGVPAWWLTGLAWRAWRFEVGARALHLQHGVLIRRASTIPFHRVQHIDLEAGPLERRLGLTTLVLRTASASSDSTVPGIDARHAQTLRSQILDLVGTGDAT